jgi:hypothetical protein
MVTQVDPWQIVIVEPVIVPVQPPVQVMVPSGLTTMSANTKVENTVRHKRAILIFLLSL